MRPEVVNRTVDISDSMKNLCTRLESSHDSSAPFALEADEQHLFQLQCTARWIAFDTETRLVKLSSILENPKFQRQQRFELASILATLILQTHSTPWLLVSWVNDQVLLLQGTTISTAKPYLACSSSKAFRAPKTTSPVTSFDERHWSDEETREAFLHLGIVLLELIFNRRLKDHPLRKDYFGPNGQPNDQTDFSTARKWVNEVEADCGFAIANAIKNCISCSIGPKPNLGDWKFREEVYNAVVKPLQDAYSMTWGSLEM